MIDRTLHGVLLPLIRSVTTPDPDTFDKPSVVYGDAEPFFDDRLDDLFRRSNPCVVVAGCDYREQDGELVCRHCSGTFEP